MALRSLHRAMDVRAVAHIGLLGSDAADERSFGRWCEELLPCVLAGAGFAVEDIENTFRDDCDGVGPQLTARVRRLETLPDTVGPGMRLLLVGLNPSPHAASSGVGFSGPSNRGWPALLRSGLATVDRDPVSLLLEHRVGMTDLVKRTTRRASELLDEEYRVGLERLEQLCAWLAPAAVCVVGLSGWRTAVDRHASPGQQVETVGGRPVWLMPNPSGLNAHVTLDELALHLKNAMGLADSSDNQRGP
jgi:TDG/mug DNA glycosylase family protein